MDIQKIGPDRGPVEGFRKNLVESKGVPAEKVRIIPTWIDSNEIRRFGGSACMENGSMESRRMHS